MYFHKDRVQKVSLMNVRKVVTSIMCAKKCLTKVLEMEIMRLRYRVWINCKTYEERVTWILMHMQSCKRENNSTRWVDFQFYINGVHVCSACYAHALGYSPRQVERWKEDICGRDRQSACHGNALKPQESTHVTTARAIFRKYVSGCGCTQPHRHHMRKKDGVMVPLVLLPMNAKKKDIQKLVNDSLIVVGEKEISISAFHAMWREFFSHV